MVLFHKHSSSVAHVENEFIRHIACPNCGSSDANAIYTDGHTFCHKCHHRTHGDGTPTIHTHTMSDVELKGSATRLAARKISEKTSELFKTYKDGQVLRHYYFDVDGKFLSEISAVETDMNGRTNMPEAFSYFREDFITSLSGIWQQKNLYTLEDRADIHVELPVSNLQSWYRLRLLLSELPIVQSLSVVKLTSSSGLLKLSLSGSVEALQMAVRSIGYRLEVAGAVYQLKLDTS